MSGIILTSGSYGLSVIPSLDLDFISSSVLDPRITFTRTSTATYFDSTGVLQSAANNVARFDYDPSTLTPRGLLIEDSRTNSIRNNTMQGASAGVAPTNWLSWNVTTNGVTIASSAAGTENGIAYIDVAVSGTCTLTGTAHTPSFETATQVAATVGQTWTESVYWTLVSGSLGDSSFNVRLTEADSGGLSLASGDSATVVPAVGNLRSARYTFTRTLTNASTAFLIPRLRFGFVNGSTYSFTLRIGLPQLENNNLNTGVSSATVASGGSGYAVGDILEINGGTGTKARVTVATLSGSAVATVTVSTAGSYSVFPSPQPVNVTAITGTGTSATFNIVPQTQAGFATSVIPTTTIALTRATDVASVNTLTPWYNATEGTLFAEYVYSTTGVSNQCAFSLDDLTSANNIVTFSNSTPLNVVGSSTSGVNQLTANLGNYTFAAGQIIKRAIGYKLNDFGTSVNGGAAATDNTYNVPTISRLTIGAAGYFTQSRINGWLRRIIYYPRRFINAELSATTSR